QPTNLTPPQVQNIRVTQRSGTMFVDILYNLVDPDSTNIYVIAEFSSDGGAAYGLPIFSLQEVKGRIVCQLDNGPRQTHFLSRTTRQEHLVLDRFGIFNFQLPGDDMELYLS